MKLSKTVTVRREDGRYYLGEGTPIKVTKKEWKKIKKAQRLDEEAQVIIHRRSYESQHKRH